MRIITSPRTALVLHYDIQKRDLMRKQNCCSNDGGSELCGIRRKLINACAAKTAHVHFQENFRLTD